MHGQQTIQHSVPVILVSGLLLALAACGGAGNSGSVRSTVVSHTDSLVPLQCEFHETPTNSPGGIGFGGGTLSCQVTGVSSSETAFTLTYSLNEATCRGSLVHGAGSCTASYLANSFPLTSLGSVAGELLPDHHPLGPVTPLSVPPLVLRCAFHEMPNPASANVFAAEVSCQVTGAASDERAFTLVYSLNGARCSGSLMYGAGGCAATFTLTNSLTSLGTLAGKLLPDNHPLGPVAPFPEP